MNAKAITLLPEQLAIDNWVREGEGNLEIRARAGTGKTFMLMHMVDVIRRKYRGDTGVLMAFNKSIADELKTRLSDMGVDWKVFQAGTVHSFGFSAWKKVAPDTQLVEDKVMQIIMGMFNNTGDPVYKVYRKVINQYVGFAKQWGLGAKGCLPMRDMNAWHDIWENFDLETMLQETQSENNPDNVSADEDSITSIALAVYKESLAQCWDCVDFNDMILAPLYHGARFFKKDWVMVDECQDTNPIRRALALEMLAPGGRFVYVGDDRQAIYGFTGANGDSMDRMRAITGATVLPLTVTMRCPVAVVAEAQRIVPDIKAKEGAAQGKITHIDYHQLLAQKPQAGDAILCRNNAPLVATAFMLIRQGIACQVEGRDIAESLTKLAKKWRETDVNKYRQTLRLYRQSEVKRLTALDKMERVAQLEDQIDCLMIMIEMVVMQGGTNMSDVVARIDTLFGVPDNRKRTITLTSIHRSKGREWKRVFCLGRESYMPSRYAKLEWQKLQEANLEYVMLTRAGEELVFVKAPPQPQKKDEYDEELIIEDALAADLEASCH